LKFIFIGFGVKFGWIASIHVEISSEVQLLGSQKIMHQQIRYQSKHLGTHHKSISRKHQFRESLLKAPNSIIQTGNFIHPLKSIPFTPVDS
jgi:hypothetical protein